MKYFPVTVIGGGIVGAGIFWDLSLHGVDTLLLDRGDFASQTSQSSSKMLHGGIRYLENLDFHLVFEALHEKNLWKERMPELCKEKSFVLPIYKESKYNLPMTQMGLFTYDLLSSFKNSPYRILSKQQTVNLNPSLKESTLKGAGVYYDVVVDDAKLNLEIIFDGLAQNKNSQALNYKKVIEITEEGHDYLVTYLDTLTGEQEIVKTSEVVVCTGPFTDQFMQKVAPFAWDNQLLPSKGIHLWLQPDALEINTPTVLQTKDGRILFVIPHENAILVGTTESQTSEDFFNIQSEEEEILYILDNLNHYFAPTVHRSSVISSFAGVRPLAKNESSSADRGKTSREHKVLQPRSNFHVIVGGKYTTFRVMGQDITRVIVGRLGQIPYNPLKTADRFQPHSHYLKAPEEMPSKKIIQEIIRTEFPRTIDDLLHRRLSVYSPNHWQLEESMDEFRKRYEGLF